MMGLPLLTLLLYLATLTVSAVPLQLSAASDHLPADLRHRWQPNSLALATTRPQHPAEASAMLSPAQLPQLSVSLPYYHSNTSHQSVS